VRSRGLALAASLFAASVPAFGQGNELPEDVRVLLDGKRYAEALPKLEALSRQGNQSGSFLLANFYVCGKLVRFSCVRAEQLFSAALDSRNGAPAIPEISRYSKNEVAWINAACEEPGFTGDLEKAMRLSLEAVNEEPDPYTVDTLAAVLAKAGNFERAVEAQKQALRRLEQAAKQDDIPPVTFDEFRKRLALYGQRKPARFDASNATANCNALPE
jgi:tetratricopeptide (TPR) repeat protein